MKLLVIEDDELIGQGIQNLFISRDHHVEWLTSANVALECIDQNSFDIVILDLNLPGQDGLGWLKAARASGMALPVLILTARDALEDRVRGLDIGADDYLLKPFAFDELEARTRALYRRLVGRSDETITLGALHINLNSREVSLKGQTQELTRREYALLLYLIDHKGRVLTRRQLEEALYDLDENPESNALEVHIHALRKKLGKESIRTIRGIGYQWVIV
jgi:DNA-binding response OmpR family regulator